VASDFVTVPASAARGDEKQSIDQAADVAEVIAVERRSDPNEDLGATGLRRHSGYVSEQFLPQLRGKKAVEVFREMYDNEPLVGGFMHAITMLVRNVDWTVKPGGNSKRDEKAAEFIDSCKDDMDTPWSDFIAEALSMLPYGWSWHEMVFKTREGPFNPDPKRNSRYNDGLIGIRRLPIRSQDSLQRWVFDAEGQVVGMVQNAAPTYKMVTIPASKSLLFRLWAPKGNPEGRSILRNAYRPWYMKKRIEEFEAVGVERDLAGMPVIKVPAEYLSKTATPAQKETVRQMTKTVRSVRRNEQEGIVFPISYDQDTKQPLFDLSLLGSGGGRQFQTQAIIERYEQRILMSVLADFIMVGHQQSGSYSLHTDKTGIFRTTLNAIAESIADVLNRQLVPTLLKLNNMTDLEKMPQFEPNDVDSPDIAVLGQFMSSMAAMGVQWFPDAELEQFVRKAARLPELGEDEEKRERLLARRAEATRFMQQQAEYVQTRMGLQQAVAGVGPQNEQQVGPDGKPVQQPGQGPPMPGATGNGPPGTAQVGAAQQPGNRQQGGQ
jgi:hypothetical protein